MRRPREAVVVRGGRRSKEEKAGLVERWCESGLSRAEFCRREGICYGSFLNWIGQWVDGTAEAPEFVEVVEETAQAESSVESGGIELVAPNGWRVRMSGAVVSRDLERVVEVLGRC
jgi:transposase-like protein